MEKNNGQIQKILEACFDCTFVFAVFMATITSRLFLCVLLTLISFEISFGAAAESEGAHDEVRLRDEDDVNKLREEAISKLDTPLEKMKIKVYELLSCCLGVYTRRHQQAATLIDTV
jgi:hypothetical protein